MPRAWKSPVTARDATSSATQWALPFLEPALPAKSLTPVQVRRLWFCVWLPCLSLEACRCSDEATAIVEEQQGIHRIVLADAKAQAAGVMAGQSANAALALLPTLELEERSLPREQQALETLATWLERFSSFVSIADRDVLLLEIAGSLRLFGGLRELRKTISKGLRKQGFTASLAIAPTPLGATWLARAGRRVCIRDEQNLGTALRGLPLASLNWPQGLCESLSSMGVTRIGDCLRLPREGFVRRFGAQHMLALDRALGRLPDQTLLARTRMFLRRLRNDGRTIRPRAVAEYLPRVIAVAREISVGTTAGYTAPGAQFFPSEGSGNRVAAGLRTCRPFGRALAGVIAYSLRTTAAVRAGHSHSFAEWPDTATAGGIGAFAISGCRTAATPFDYPACRAPGCAYW